MDKKISFKELFDRAKEHPAWEAEGKILELEEENFNLKQRNAELEKQEDLPRKANNWIYIYYIKDNDYHYLNSVPRDCLYRAEELVKEARAKGKEAFYSIGCVVTGAFI